MKFIKLFEDHNRLKPQKFLDEFLLRKQGDEFNAIKDCIESSLPDISDGDVKYQEYPNSNCMTAAIMYEFNSVEEFKSNFLSMFNKLKSDESYVKVYRFVGNPAVHHDSLTNEIDISIFAKGLLRNKLYKEDTHGNLKRGENIERNESIDLYDLDDEYLLFSKYILIYLTILL